MTYNRKTLFFFANVANFTEAKNFLHGLSINWRYGLNGVANGRKVAYIEVSPRNAVKYDLDLRLDGLYIAMCSSFTIPAKKK